MSRCFFKQFAPEGLRECDGPVQSHHVIKRQTIRRLFPQLPMFATDAEIRDRKHRLNKAIADRRNQLLSCKRHHDLHEKAKRIPVPRDEVPPAVEQFAVDFDLVYELERQFGVPGGERAA